MRAQRNLRGYVHAALSGAIVSFWGEAGMCWLMAQEYCLTSNMMGLYGILAGIGMVCALLLARIFLHAINTENRQVTDSESLSRE